MKAWVLEDFIDLPDPEFHRDLNDSLGLGSGNGREHPP